MRDDFYHYFLSFIYVLFFDFHILGGSSPNRGRGGGPNKGRGGPGGRGGRWPGSPRNLDPIEDSIGTKKSIKVLKFLHLEVYFH